MLYKFVEISNSIKFLSYLLEMSNYIVKDTQEHNVIYIRQHPSWFKRQHNRIFLENGNTGHNLENNIIESPGIVLGNGNARHGPKNVNKESLVLVFQ